MDHLVINGTRHLDPAMAFRQRDDPPGDRNPRADARGDIPLAAGIGFQPHHFRRAAADIEQHHAVITRIGQFETAGSSQLRLGLAGDNFQRQAGFALDPIKEFDTVDRRPASLGGNQARAFDGARRHTLRADFQGLDGPADRLFAQPVGTGNAFTQPHDARKSLDNPDPMAGGPRKQQAAVIGAQIKRGIDRTLAALLIRQIIMRVGCRQTRATHRGCLAGGRDGGVIGSCWRAVLCSVTRLA